MIILSLIICPEILLAHTLSPRQAAVTLPELVTTGKKQKNKTATHNMLSAACGY